MRMLNPQVDHGGLGGLLDNDHTQYLRLAGGNMTGVIQLDNGLNINALEVGGTARRILEMDTSDRVAVGSTSNAQRHIHNGTIEESTSVSAKAVLSTRRHVSVVKSVDEIVNNSTTFQNDDALTFAVLANENWSGLLLLRFNSSTVADLKWQFSVPAGCSVAGRGIGDLSSPSNETDLTGLQTLATGGSDQLLVYVIHIRVGATAGTVVVQWAQNTAEVSDTKMLEGSMLEIHRDES